MKPSRWLALAFLFLARPALAGDPATSPSWTKEKEIVLEGGTSFDLMTFDAAGGRLYVAHSPNVDVVDTAKGERIGVVEGVDRAHGIAIVPDAKRGFATAGKSNRLVVFDLATLKTVKEVETGENPDAVLWVSSAKEVWSFNGKSKNVTCVDPVTLEVKATIALDGKPELAVEDAAKGMVWVNLEDKNAACSIDAKKHAVVATRALAPGEGPTGLAFDAKDSLLLAGCGNKKLVAFGAADGAVVASADIGDHCDGVVFDAGAGDVVATGRDVTTVLHAKDAKTLERRATLDTPGGKTCALDAKNHRLYVATGPKRGEAGTVKVLVFVLR